MSDSQRIIEELYTQYSSVIYAKCLRILGDRQEAQDAVQQTFLSAYRGLHTFRYGDSHLPWLYLIATNASLKLLKSRQRAGFLMRDTIDQDRASGGAPRVVSRIHARRVLGELLDELDERGLQIVVAHYVDGMNQTEIAEQLGVSRRSVVKRLTKLRRRFGNLLGPDHA